ncbi:hypothetical protein ABIF65_006525 [Bradyrhizobium japonicum]|uniref:hypothetical protein n=1 Tax=Bradyrhizobium TaxID=374 RepID=UPI0004818B8E|nr:hypothetical protein [Bradyrhizobium japonicum]MCW2326468.1 hypothetical protein [Bradyrhizobium japonicum]
MAQTKPSWFDFDDAPHTIQAYYERAVRWHAARVAGNMEKAIVANLAEIHPRFRRKLGFAEVIAEYKSGVAGEITGQRSDAMSEPGNPLVFILFNKPGPTFRCIPSSCRDLKAGDATFTAAVHEVHSS